MKKMKKLLAMIMAMTMVLGMAMTVSAAEKPDESDSMLVVNEIHNVDPNASITAYQIIDAVYNENGFVKYTWVAGTLNGHGIAGLNAALYFIERVGIQTIHSKEISLAKRFIEGIQSIDGIKLYGDLEASERAAIVSLNIGDMDSSVVSDILWEDYEICVRAGAHCAPLMHETLGTVEQGTVRFSFSYFNTEEEVDEAIKAIGEIACE